jgi:probable O-glycosylation ligase (exosortase A-associated)
MTTTVSTIREGRLSVQRKRIARTARRTGFGLPFWLTVLYLAFEYGRPQNSFPAVGYLHLPGVVTVSLALALLTSGHVDLSNIQTKLFIVFLGLMAALVPFAVNNYWALYTTLAMLILFIDYLAIVNFVDSFQKFQFIINAWIGFHVYLAIIVIIKKGTGIGGFFGDENDVALVLNMIIPFSFFLALEAKTQSKRIWFLVITGIFLVAIAATSSRGGFIGLVAVGLYCWLRSPRKLMSAMAVLLLIFTILQFAPKGYWDEMDTITTDTDDPYGTGQGRIYAWKAGWRMFLDYPILGVGPGNFPWNFQDYEPAGGFGGHDGMEGQLHGGRAAHSLYLTVIPELGTVGTILFAWLVLSSLRDLRFMRKRIREQPQQSADDRYFRERVRYLTLALGGSLAGFLVSGTFLSVLYYPNFWIWMALVVALKRQVVSSVAVPERVRYRWARPLKQRLRSMSSPS